MIYGITGLIVGFVAGFIVCRRMALWCRSEDQDVETRNQWYELTSALDDAGDRSATGTVTEARRLKLNPWRAALAVIRHWAEAEKEDDEQEEWQEGWYPYRYNGQDREGRQRGIEEEAERR